MTKITPLLIVSLLLLLAACGKSGSQQESAPGKPGAADDTSGLCAFIEHANLAKRCAVNIPDTTINVTIDSFDDQAARNACAEIAGKAAQLTARFSLPWNLRVFSPYRDDKPLATCPLHPAAAY